MHKLQLNLQCIKINITYLVKGYQRKKATELKKKTFKKEERFADKQKMHKKVSSGKQKRLKE